MKLNLTADEVLTTTRAVRKRLDFDKEVEMEVIRDCLEIALQAPTGSNAQGWHFVLVTDAGHRAKIAEYYQRAFVEYAASPNQPTMQHQDDAAMAATQERVLSSAQYLADNMAQVPAMLIPCCSPRLDIPGMPNTGISSIAGSIIPAAWSFMLAARERGLGTCWTTLHLNFEAEIGEMLNIPEDYNQIALIPIAYTLGTDFKPGPRKPLDPVLHVNGW